MRREDVARSLGWPGPEPLIAGRGIDLASAHARFAAWTVRAGVAEGGPCGESAYGLLPADQRARLDEPDATPARLRALALAVPPAAALTGPALIRAYPLNCPGCLVELAIGLAPAMWEGFNVGRLDCPRCRLLLHLEIAPGGDTLTADEYAVWLERWGDLCADDLCAARQGAFRCARELDHRGGCQPDPMIARDADHMAARTRPAEAQRG